MNLKTSSNIIYITLTLLNFLFILFTFSYNFSSEASFLLIIKNFYGNICHQIDNRCLVVFGKPMLICSRCAGIYSGSFLLFLLITLFEKLRLFLDKMNYSLILFFSLPIIIDWSLSFIFKIESTNFVRFFTGIIFSIVPVYFINSLIIRRGND